MYHDNQDDDNETDELVKIHVNITKHNGYVVKSDANDDSGHGGNDDNIDGNSDITK